MSVPLHTASHHLPVVKPRLVAYRNLSPGSEPGILVIGNVVLFMAGLQTMASPTSLTSVHLVASLRISVAGLQVLHRKVH